MDIKRAWQSLRFSTFFSALKRGDYIRQHNIYGRVGKDVRLPSGLIPLHSECIFLHNNIEIASGARLIPHDAIHSVLSRIDDNNYPEHIGKIEIFDNVFIGANAQIIGPCNIGPNAIVAAGAIVCEDVPPGAVVGGVPARVINSFEELKKKREKHEEIKC